MKAGNASLLEPRQALAAALVVFLPLAAALAQGPAPAAAVPAQPLDPAGSPTLIGLLQMGGPLMYPLYLCSLLTVAFGIERAVSLRRSKVLPSATVERIRAFSAQHGDVAAARALLGELQAEGSPIARVIAAGLRKAGQPIPDVEKSIEDAGAREAAMLRRNGRVLSITASLSPLLGLLGTVFGMIQAFMTVAASEEALGRTGLLAAGIYQALVTTAVGLSIAIPALVLYHIFAEKVDRLVTEMDDLSIDLVEALSKP
jgi:biopolymer transport protein ExbB